MDAFDHMLNHLSSDAFCEVDRKQTISKKEYNHFLKEYTFEKLKGKSLGTSFAEKFKIKDRVLYMLKEDSNALLHIKSCGYIKK